MYDLKGFIPYDGETLKGGHKVLAWGQKTGYYFTEFGFVAMDSNFKVVAKEK